MQYTSHNRHRAKQLFTLVMSLFVLGNVLLVQANPKDLQSTKYRIFLPGIFGSAQPGSQPTPSQPAPTPPTPTLPPANMPATLVGTWFHGQILNREFYDPDSKTWQDPGGLAHMYIFEANGNYILASYLKIQTGLGCVSQVWKYEKGRATVEGSNLLLTPASSRTRTKVDCGSHTDTELEGAHTTRAVPWQLAEDDGHHSKLLLSENNSTTDYYKDGLAPQILGKWKLGDLSSANFYDPATGSWGMPAGAGEWLQLFENGTFRYGKFGLVYQDGCELAMQVYQEGQLTGSGSTISMKSSAGARRWESSCAPGTIDEEQWVDPELSSYAWKLLGTPPSQLSLLRIMPFGQRTFEREE